MLLWEFYVNSVQSWVSRMEVSLKKHMHHFMWHQDSKRYFSFHHNWYRSALFMKDSYNINLTGLKITPPDACVWTYTYNRWAIFVSFLL